MKIIVRFAYVLLILILPAASWAFDLSGQSRTYLQYREASDTTKLLPLYEYLDFKASDKSEMFSFHFGGWYRYDLQDESFGTKSTGDLQYAYMRYRSAKDNAYANLGRLVVNQGAAAEHLDGIAAGTDLLGGFDISAFGGIPVETDFDTRSGDSLYGGRISQGLDGLYRIGLSYLNEKNDSKDYREEEGLDLWFRPLNSAELVGSMLYNANTSANALTSLYLTLGPFQNITLRTQYMAVSYKDYFATTLNNTLSAFRLISGGTGTGFLDPNEKLALVGEEVSLSLGKMNVSVDYKKYNYDIAGSADYYGAKVAYTGGQNDHSGLAVHRMDGETKDLQYSEYRVYTSGKFQNINLTADALVVKYDVPINGVKNAYTAVLAGGYALSPKTTLGADVEYAKNPYYDKDVRAMLKLAYNFDFTPAAPVAPAAPARKKVRN